MAPTTPDLSSYDRILVNSSAGKDSQAMLDYLVELADSQGVSRDRIVVVHCDLGRVEWQGTLELAREQAEHYGLRFEVVQRDLGDLLTQVEQRHEANLAKDKQQPLALLHSLVHLGPEDLQVLKLITSLDR